MSAQGETVISDRQKKKNALRKSLAEQQGGWPRHSGFYSFTADQCVNFLRLYPSQGETRHISEIIADTYYGPDQDFDWTTLAPGCPETVGGTGATEENGDESINDVFFATETYPPLEWVQQISLRYPTLEVVLDYAWESRELLGRVWFSGGKLYKQAHLTHFHAIEVIAHRENGKKPAGNGLLRLVEASESD